MAFNNNWFHKGDVLGIEISSEAYTHFVQTHDIHVGKF